MSQLEKAFEDKVRSAIRECRELGYHPNDFAKMLETSSTVAVATRLVTSGDIQTGLKRLAALGRPDLSIESIMLEAEFKPLFPAQIREAAAWRLRQI